MASQRTDYMPIEEFRRRANEHELGGWTPILPKPVVLLTPTFDLDFDRFAANVAYELRHYIVYRSDGGYFARGLVRATQELQGLHAELKGEGYPPGQKITIAAALYRRSHREPTSRWMMSIKFARVSITADEAMAITASPQVTLQSERNLAERILDFAAQAANEPSWAGDRKKRLGDWVDLARKIGFPGFLDLWYYDRGLVALYVQVQFENERGEMTGHRDPPFDGHYRGMDWRVYPFRMAMAECKKKTSVDDCYAHVANQLAQAERDIFSQIDDIYRTLAKSGPAQSLDPRPGSITGSPERRFRSLAPFLKDLKKRLYDPNTLYGAFTKYSQTQPGFWDRY